MATDASEVVKILKAAREPVGFAFGSNTSSGELVAEKGKTGDQLLAAVKRMNGIKQSCAGMAHYDGSILTLICDRPIANLGKLVEAWGKANKFTVKAAVTNAKAERAHEAESEGADEEEEEEEGSVLFAFETVKRRLMQAKTKPMFFAFGLSTHKAPDLLGLHPQKSSEKLMLAIRKENGAIKRASGTATVNGSMVTFLCEDEPFTSMKRSLRALFKAWKLALRITIIGPRGEFIEAGDEDEDEGQQAETQEASAGTDPQRLQTELAALLPGLKQLFVSRPGDAEAIRHDYAACQAAIKTGNADDAEGLLAKLRAYSANPPITNGSNAELARLKASLDAMLPGLKELAKDPALAQQIRGHWQAADSALKSGNADAATTEIEALAAISAGGGDSQSAESEGEEDDGIDYAALVRVWTQARTGAAADLKGLEAEVLATFADTPEIGELRQKVRRFDDVLERLGKEMADILTAAGQAAGAERAKLRRNAQGILSRHFAYVEADGFLAQIDDNPFQPVQVKRRFAKALEAIEAALVD